MSDRFAAAKLKIERANKHILELEPLIAALPKAHVSSIKRHPHLPWHVLTYSCPDVRKRTDEMALIIGDAIHNIRVAVEYAYLGAVERDIPAIFDDHTKFPANETRAGVEKLLKRRKVDVINPAFFKKIVSDIKPYTTDNGNSLLYYIHKLDVSDKHWLLLPTLKVAQVIGLSLQDKYGADFSGDTLPIMGEGPYRINVQLDNTIKDNGELSISVSISDIKILQSVPILGLLDGFSKTVIHTIQVLESI